MKPLHDRKRGSSLKCDPDLKTAHALASRHHLDGGCWKRNRKRLQPRARSHDTRPLRPGAGGEATAQSEEGVTGKPHGPRQPRRLKLKALRAPGACGAQLGPKRCRSARPVCASSASLPETSPLRACAAPSFDGAAGGRSTCPPKSFRGT